MPVQTQIENALSLFPPGASHVLGLCIHAAPPVYEIRIYTNKAIVLNTARGNLFCLNGGAVASFPSKNVFVPDEKLVWDVISAAASYAPFLHERELRSAYITAFGCRIGVCGMSEDGKRLSGGVSSVNIRLPYAMVDYFLPEEYTALLAHTRGLLIVGPPASGKTTFLKKCVFALCGAALGYKRVSVIDEREEFKFDVTRAPEIVTADLICGTSKESGIQTALRLFSPEYILCDEIGGCGETQRMLEGMNSGVRFVASMHASDRHELCRREQFRILWQAGIFEHVLFLSAVEKGRVESILKRGDGL